jgi:DNA-binding GntR family transcriptional regulator
MNNPVSLKDSIYKAILQDILSYEYKPNDILNEKALVEKYGCSKSPVREALLELCADNVLRSIPRYGYEVIRVTRDDVRDMLQYRYILERGLLLEHFRTLSDTQIDRLSDINEKCSKAADIWEHWAYNTEFHLKLIFFCGNSYAAESLRRCMDRLKRAYAQFYWDDPDGLHFSMDTRNHEAIMLALRQKDPLALANALAEDMNDFGGKRLYTADKTWLE